MTPPASTFGRSGREFAGGAPKHGVFKRSVNRPAEVVEEHLL